MPFCALLGQEFPPAAIRSGDSILTAVLITERRFHKSFTGESKPAGDATTKPGAEGAATRPVSGRDNEVGMEV